MLSQYSVDDALGSDGVSNVFWTTGRDLLRALTTASNSERHSGRHSGERPWGEVYTGTGGSLARSPPSYPASLLSQTSFEKDLPWTVYSVELWSSEIITGLRDLC